jgi:6-phosphogluconolactonase
MKPEIVVLEDAPALQARAKDEVVRVLGEAVAQRGRASLALSGGSTPKGLYRLLAQERGLAWDRVHLFFGDERHVPPDDADSNYRMAREALLDPLIQAGALPPANVHRVEAERPAADAARHYEDALRRFFGPGLPMFDLILLGMGPDGHTASLFPHTPALEERSRQVVANPVAKLSTQRITFTYPVLDAAREVLFLVAGAEKAQPLWEVLRSPEAKVADFPSKGVQPEGRLLFLVDRAAAAKLG